MWGSLTALWFIYLWINYLLVYDRVIQSGHLGPWGNVIGPIFWYSIITISNTNKKITDYLLIQIVFSLQPCSAVKQEGVCRQCVCLVWWRSSCRFNKWASATAGLALRLHTPLSKQFCCRVQCVPLFLSAGEWHAILNRYYIEKQQGESKFAFILNMSWTPAGLEVSVPSIIYWTLSVPCCVGVMSDTAGLQKHSYHCPGPPSAPPVL